MQKKSSQLRKKHHSKRRSPKLHSKRKSRNSKRHSKRKSPKSKRHSKRKHQSKFQKGGESSLLKSFLLDPVSKSSNLISNLKDHNVLVDRFSEMKNEMTKINKRLDQLETAFKKLQLQK